MPRRKLLRLLPLLCIAGLSLGSPRAAVADETPHSFAYPMFGDHSEALWPIALAVEIVAVDGDEMSVPARELVVADGQHMTLSEVVATRTGRRVFELEIVARHHAGEAIELEYDLAVRDARFAELNWGNYLMHRLALAPRPEVGPDALAAAQADIVETRADARGEAPVHREQVEVDGDRYEIRLYAASLRG